MCSYWAIVPNNHYKYKVMADGTQVPFWIQVACVVFE